jgi:hypothetical protein
MILKQLGFTHSKEVRPDPDEEKKRVTLFLAEYHIDHILPLAKDGKNHPINYYIMPKSDNLSFGGGFSAAKLAYVGAWAGWAVLYFHIVLLAQEAGAGPALWLADELLLLQFAPVAAGGNSLLQ